jgi:cytochrome c biogenesis factor
VAASSVLLGTLYPLFMDALNLGKLSVGPPYFNAVFVPLMAPAMFLIGVGPIARWKQAKLPELAIRLRWAFVISLISGCRNSLLHRRLAVARESRHPPRNLDPCHGRAKHLGPPARLVREK